MSASDAVHGFVVGVPARNEERRIVSSVRSVLAAIDHLDADVPAVVVVADDGSFDGTHSLLVELAEHHPGLHVLPGHWNSAGAARRAAIDHGLAVMADLQRLDTHHIWIGTTDADTIVPADWLAIHRRHAEAGHDAVAGIVDILDDSTALRDLVATFDRMYTLGDETHPHVHGANLGIRADAYLSTGGFPPVALAEDHGLWNELRRHEFRTISPVDLCVSTSARLVGRAAGGFAHTLQAIA